MRFAPHRAEEALLQAQQLLQLQQAVVDAETRRHLADDAAQRRVMAVAPVREQMMRQMQVRPPSQYPSQRGRVSQSKVVANTW